MSLSCGTWTSNEKTKERRAKIERREQKIVR